MSSRRPSPSTPPRLGSIAFAASLALGACISGEDVDLGQNLEPGAPGAGSGRFTPPASGGDAGALAASGACETTEVNRPAFCDATAGAADSAPSSQSAPSSGAVPSSDASATAFCIPNPSFEIANSTSVIGPPPDWQTCPSSSGSGLANLAALLPMVNPSLCTMPPSNGSSYLGLVVGPYGSVSSDLTASVSTALCGAALDAGTAYALSIDLGIAVTRLVSTSIPSNTPSSIAPVLQLWAGQTPCAYDELLWTSPPISNEDTWKTACATFTPRRTASNLTLSPVFPTTDGSAPQHGQWSYVVMDNLVPGRSCP